MSRLTHHDDEAEAEYELRERARQDALEIQAEQEAR